MARSLFDASRMSGPPDPPGGSRGSDDAMTVADLAMRIEDALRTGLPTRVRVVGEISSPTNRTHWYFTLKDDDAAISCVLFAAEARRSTTLPEHGDRVIATGRVQHYAKQGRTQLYIERLEPAGRGALEARLRALIDELRAEGYFDETHKRALPVFPRRIAVITSRTGAALQDVLDTARRRCPSVDWLIVDTRVQGDDAGRRIASLVRTLDARAERLGLDALLITRGGGSLEDLWPFNDRALADALRACSLPAVCAIGHETDTTVCELVADRRCATPTQAAMALTPDRDALLEQLSMLRSRHDNAVRVRLRVEEDRTSRSTRGLLEVDLTGAHTRRLSAGEQALDATARARLTSMHLRLERLAGRLALAKPESAHAERLYTLDRAAQRLRRAVQHRVDRDTIDRAAVRLHRAGRRDLDEQRTALDALERELVLVSPASVLERGYSLTTRADSGALVRSQAEAPSGTRLVTRLRDGSIRSVVEGEGASAPPPSTSPLPPRKRKKKRDSPGQLGLF